MKLVDFAKCKRDKDGVYTPNEILDKAKDCLTDVIIIGEGIDSDMFFSSNILDKGKLILLVEEFKMYLLLGRMDADGEE